MQGPFFGMSKRQFTSDEIKAIAQAVADGLARSSKGEYDYGRFNDL